MKRQEVAIPKDLKEPRPHSARKYAWHKLTPSSFIPVPVEEGESFQEVYSRVYYAWAQYRYHKLKKGEPYVDISLTCNIAAGTVEIRLWVPGWRNVTEKRARKAMEPKKEKAWADRTLPVVTPETPSS